MVSFHRRALSGAALSPVCVGMAGPRGAPRCSLVPARPATQSPGPACTPGGTDIPGWVVDPARYASRGWRPRPPLTPGWAQGRRCRGRGLGEPVPRGPGTVWKEPWVKSSPLLPGSSSPLHVGPPPYLLFGVRLSFSRSEWVRPGRRGVAGGAGARGSADQRAATRAPGLGLPLLGAQHPRAPFPIWTRELRLIPPLAPLVQFRKLLASVPGRLFPGGAVSPGVPPSSRFLLRGPVCSASLFGMREPLGTSAPSPPAAAAAPS